MILPNNKNIFSIFPRYLYLINSINPRYLFSKYSIVPRYLSYAIPM